MLIPIELIVGVVTSLAFAIVYLFKMIISLSAAEKKFFREKLEEAATSHTACREDVIELRSKLSELNGRLDKTDEIYSLILRAINDSRDTRRAQSADHVSSDLVGPGNNRT